MAGWLVGGCGGGVGGSSLVCPAPQPADREQNTILELHDSAKRTQEKLVLSSLKDLGKGEREKARK